MPRHTRSGGWAAIDGIVAIEHGPSVDGSARLRVNFTAHPKNDEQPRTTPNEHTFRTAWATLDELDTLPLRGAEVRAIAEHVLEGRATYPLSLLRSEHDRWE